MKSRRKRRRFLDRSILLTTMTLTINFLLETWQTSLFHSSLFFFRFLLNSWRKTKKKRRRNGWTDTLSSFLFPLFFSFSLFQSFKKKFQFGRYDWPDLRKRESILLFSTNHSPLLPFYGDRRIFVYCVPIHCHFLVSQVVFLFCSISCLRIHWKRTYFMFILWI